MRQGATNYSAAVNKWHSHSVNWSPWTKWLPFRNRYFQMHFREWKVLYFGATISLKCFPRGPIDNNPALVQIMAWCRMGDKPLSEQMLTRSTDAYIRHWGKWVKSERCDDPAGLRQISMPPAMTKSASWSQILESSKWHITTQICLHASGLVI